MNIYLEWSNHKSNTNTFYTEDFFSEKKSYFIQRDGHNRIKNILLGNIIGCSQKNEVMLLCLFSLFVYLAQKIVFVDLKIGIITILLKIQ